MRLRLTAASAAVAALSLLAGCSGEDRGELMLGGPDAGEQEEPPGDVMLMAIADAEVTPWSTVMISGTGPAQGTLVVNSSERGVEERSLGSTGDFCIDVSLGQGENSIKLEAVAVDGAYSEPMFFSVTRQGEPPEDEERETGNVVDRTDGATYYSNADGGSEGGVKLIEGDWPSLVDGDTSGLLKFEGQALHNEAVAYKLAERMRVAGFEVTVPENGGDGCGPDAFEIYLADGAEPEMAFDGISWIKVAEVSTEDRLRDGGTYSLDASFSVNATYFAVRGTNASCEPWVYYNQYGFNEVRVLAAEAGGNDPVESPTPNCANSER